MIRRSINRAMIRYSYSLALAPGIPIQETIVVMSPQNQLMILPENSGVQVCSQHVLANLPEIVQVVFNQNGVTTTLFADRKCTVCGQYFFCYPDDAPPPIHLAPPQGMVQQQAPIVQQQQQPQVGYAQPQQTQAPPGYFQYQPQPGASHPTIQACGKCGYSCPIQDRFCPKCGSQLPVHCMFCGQVNPADGQFCGGCGRHL